MIAVLWLIGLALLAFGAALLLGTLVDLEQSRRLRGRVRELEHTALDASLTICALTVERDRLRRQQYAGPLTVTHRGQDKTIRIRPVASFARMFLGGN